ncbi:MAG: hypothetical protein EBT98_07755 [Opitutaceae bacterium]|nr:hypothetical protein [Opitutaceae bacterium]
MSFFRSLFFTTCAGLLALSAEAGSLWTAGGSNRSMFADHKAAQAGDILTIVVSEAVAASNSQSKKSARDSSIADELLILFIHLPDCTRGRSRAWHSRAPQLIPAAVMSAITKASTRALPFSSLMSCRMATW